MCLCGESGGQYNEDNQTAVVGGKCEVFGIRNDFFDYEPFSRERREDNRDRLIEGEYDGDEQIKRVESPKKSKDKFSPTHAPVGVLAQKFLET